MRPDQNEPDAAGVWLDVVAAVDYLSVHQRLGITVWEALEEAVRWWTTDRLTPAGELPERVSAELPWDDPDPLRSGLERLLASAAPSGTVDGQTLPLVLSSALAVWVDRMAVWFNDGRRFAHPRPRQGWPAIVVTTAD